MTENSRVCCWLNTMPTLNTILINAEFSDRLLERIRQVAPQASVISQKELRQRPEVWQHAEALVTHVVSPERLAEAKQLRWIQTLGAGVEWLLTPEVVARNELVITNASGVHPDQIAEHVFMLILALARRLPQVLDQQRQQHWDAAPFRQSIPTLAGSTLGILGVGAIGLRVAQLGAAFGMRVIGSRRGAEPAAHVERIYAPEELHALLSESHYVVNALPLTAATRGLLGPDEFAVFRKDAVFINIGRGRTVQTGALVQALTHGHLAGAGLDVTDPEPLPVDHPLWHVPNVIITPHYSGGRPNYNDLVTQLFLENLQRYTQGQPLQNVVDVRAGY